MKVLRCHIDRFGKISDARMSFDDGLNVIFAPNEAGKSTFLRFLVGMLYGGVRADIKAQRRFDSWVDQYKPWQGANYGGILWCALHAGRELEIYRSFDREDPKLEIRTSTGEDITRNYDTQRNSDILFAASHLGLTKEMFESVAVVRETETASIGCPETLRDRIANLAQSGNEKLSVRLSLTRLEDALESIGTDRASTKPYKRALDLLQELQQEQADLEARRQECSHWIAEKLDSAKEIDRHERELAASKAAALEARWHQTRLLVRSLEGIEADLHNLNLEMEALGIDPDFPVHLLDDLNRLEADRDHAESRSGELSTRLEEIAAKCTRLESEIANLPGYAELHASIETEKITEWFVGFLSLSRQRDDIQQSINRQMDEAVRMRDRLDALSPALRSGDTDWERKVRQISEQECSVSERGMATAEVLAGHKSEHIRHRTQAKRNAWLGAAALLGATAALWAVWSETIPSSMGLGIGAFLGVTAVVLIIMSSRAQRFANKAAQEVQKIESELDQMRKSVRDTQEELNQAVASAGFSNVDTFLAAARQAAADKERILDFDLRAREAELQRNQIQAEADGIYEHLKECLARVGLTCAPANLKAQIDTVRINLRHCAELISARRTALLEKENLQSDLDAANDRTVQITGRIQEILSAGHVDSIQGFRRSAQKLSKFLDLRSKAAARNRELDGLRGALTVPQWQDRLREIESLRAAQPHSAETAESPNAAFLPYQPSLEEAEQQEKVVAAALSTRREDHARLVERVRQAFHGYRSPAEIEEDLAVAQRDINEMAVNRQALTLASEEIRNLARLQQEVCAPQLNRTAEDRFLRICPGRYEEVKIDPEFRIQAREMNGIELRSVESLSRGTQDQIYLALRFGVLDLLGDPQEPAPCFLDEPFAAYDRDRMSAAFAVLKEESTRRQLILFTCRSEVRDQALAQGARILSL